MAGDFLHLADFPEFFHICKGVMPPVVIVEVSGNLAAHIAVNDGVYAENFSAVEVFFQKRLRHGNIDGLGALRAGNFDALFFRAFRFPG